MKRGIITPPYNLVFPGKGSGFHVGKILNPYDVNYFLLYWDRVVVPSNNYIGTTLHLEKEMLDMGFLERPRFEFQSNNDAMDMLEFCKHVQNVSLAKNRDESDIDWVLHEMGERQEQLESSELPSNLRFELYNALPVPPKSVHAEEILNFKIQRKDQLNSLHELMDELYKEVISSRDINFSKSHAFSRLNKAIIDVNRVSEEKWSIPLRFDVSANFETDLNAIYQSTLATGATYFAGGAHAAVATAALGGLGYIASSIKINFNKRKPLNPDVKRVEYLAHASKQNVL